MYENKLMLEPKWRSWIIHTTEPVFTPDQCKEIIECGKRQKLQKEKIGLLDGETDNKKTENKMSWIPFKEMEHVYEELDTFIQKANSNHFGFDDIRITEQAKFTEYPKGGFYDWHMDCDTTMQHEPPVRKISMTLLLNDPSKFEGGDLEIMGLSQNMELKQGHAICFASFLHHRITAVTKGVRQSLVVWFGGKPLR